MVNGIRKVGVFFGGRSTEHEISILSAKNIMENLHGFEVLPIGIDKKGKFHLRKEDIINNLPQSKELFEIRGLQLCERIPDAVDEHLSEYIDVAFPILHGYLGEDGAIQGMLKVFDVPFVGPDILGSAVCMDKEVAKRLLREAGVSIADYILLHRPESIEYDEVRCKFGDIVFVKPSSSGSSVGINRVTNKTEFDSALTEAYLCDDKIIIEKAINGREVECAVIGNEQLRVSDCCGEIVTKDHFYSYDAKYIDEDGAILKIPAPLSADELSKLKAVALKSFRVLCCEGMARVDMFITENSEVFLNEVNTIPGFTSISMYPTLLRESGMSYPQIIEELLRLAVARHERDSRLKRSK